MRIALLLSALLTTISPAMATTIAYDGLSIAADSQATAGTRKHATQKLIRCGNAFVACAGACDQGELFKAWYQSGADPDKYPKKLDDFVGIVVTQLGAFIYWDKPVAVPISAPYAIGSGAKAAEGAMRAGASAHKAVEIASLIDLYTGGQIDCHSVTELRMVASPIQLLQ
jgi:ATP-dependent protease HslVU (ClpYQ) peptidase subunit